MCHAVAQEADAFDTGLYGVSEMLAEALFGLIDAGILKRAVDGVVLHGAFFLGPKSFYRALREMPPDQIARFQMMPVSFTNELYGEEEQAPRPHRCALHQQHDDGDASRRGRLRRPRPRFAGLHVHGTALIGLPSR